jgi:heme A synthase
MSEVLTENRFARRAVQPPREASAPGVSIPRWLHGWAVGTAVAAVVLLALGAIVTTFRVGMADPVWPTQAWHLLLISWEEPSPGFLVEHAHRLAGNVVGCAAIVLAIGLWSYEPRAWLRRLSLLVVSAMIVTLALGFGLHRTNVWIAAAGCIVGTLAVLSVAAARLHDPAVWVRTVGTIALGGVMLQGLLGGFRVQLDALFGPDLAIIHGCFAQVVFAVLVALAVITGHGSSDVVETPADVRRSSSLLVGVLVVQLVVGAMLRHETGAIWQRLHLVTAFVAVAGIVWLSACILGNRARYGRLTRPALALAGLAGLQVLLGVEAWLARFSPGGLPPELRPVTIGQAVVRSGHVVVGAGVLAAAVVVALNAYRRAVPATGSLEAAA